METPPIPHFITIDRIRAEYGAHIEATLGGCVGTSCSVPEDAFFKILARHKALEVQMNNKTTSKKLKKKDKGKGNGKSTSTGADAPAVTDTAPWGVSARVERAVAEAVEDLALFSHCTFLVGTATSHFSTVAMFLAWARILAKSKFR